jgi:hypothetical protein
MKKINIQKDVESRKRIAGQIQTVMREETQVEPEKDKDDAQSEEILSEENNQGAPTGEKTKKGRRTTKGNVQEIQV